MFRNMSQLKTMVPGDKFASKCVHGSANGFVDKMFCRGFVLRGFKIDQCANDLTNEFVCSFDNRIFSRSVR